MFGHAAGAAAPLMHAPVRGGTARSGVQTGLFAALMVSGLWIWASPGQAALVLAHVGAGLGLTLLLGGWIGGHVKAGLAKSQRRVFTQSSWALLAVWTVLIGSGLVMALPVALWLAGPVWFPDDRMSAGLSLAHLWASFAASGLLGLHLALRHWVRRP